jgi:hypothetical protein
MSVGLVMEIAASVAAGTVVGGWVLDTPRRSADRAKATAEEQWFQREMEESRRLEERNRQEAFIASQLEQQAQEPGLVGDEARDHWVRRARQAAPLAIVARYLRDVRGGDHGL